MDKGFDEGLREPLPNNVTNEGGTPKTAATEAQLSVGSTAHGGTEASGETGEGDFAAATSKPVAARVPYVRQRAPHRSQAAIDDLGQDGASASGYAHDSNVAVSGKVFSGASKYRRSRGGMGRIQNSRYGQYLEIPKGRRSIFSSRERSRRRRSVLSLIVVVALLVVVALIILRLLSTR